MLIQERFMTRNACYLQGLKLPRNRMRGIMIHSTAARGVSAAEWFARWNNPQTMKLAHAFVDAQECWQYAPWTMYGAHAGGSANGDRVGIELCEDKDWSPEYFQAVWKNAVELCVKLCRIFGWTEENILSHREGHKMAIASNHGDPDHWWGQFHRSMDDFRAQVARKLKIKEELDLNKKMRVVVSDDDTLNIRATPGGAVVGKLENGTRVTVTEINAAGWMKMEKGWVWGSYLAEENVTVSLPRTLVEALMEALEEVC